MNHVVVIAVFQPGSEMSVEKVLQRFFVYTADKKGFIRCDTVYPIYIRIYMTEFIESSSFSTHRSTTPM